MREIVVANGNYILFAGRTRTRPLGAGSGRFGLRRHAGGWHFKRGETFRLAQAF